MSRPAGFAKLPGLPVVNTGNPALDRWIQAVTERLEVREGTRGNPYERAVTLRELGTMGLMPGGGGAGGGSSGVLVKQADGTVVAMSIDAFADSIRATRLYKSLLLKLDDVSRFDEIPEQVRAILLRDIAAEAAKRGADIQRLEMKLQSATESLAYTVEEVTASVSTAAAGVRDTTFAMANDNRAVAGKVTQVQARLDDVGGVTIEESMLATADRVSGLAGEYMVKINAGGAVAGFGLAASEDPEGNTQSSFIVQADKFAVVTPGLNPAIPFGVDASGVYVNGVLRVNAGGQTLENLAANAAVAAITFIGSFASAPVTSSLKKNNVYLNTSDGNSYILTADGGGWVPYLTKGTDGAKGARGSLTLYAFGSSWSDNTASNTVSAITGNAALTIGDAVTISNGSNFAETRYWSGGSWVRPGVVIDGNLLVSGSISADKIAANSLTAGTLGTNKIRVTASGSFGVFGSASVSVVGGTATVAVGASIGTPLYSWAATDIPGVAMSLVWYDHNSSAAFFRLNAWVRATGLPWSGTVPVLRIWIY